MSVNSVLERNVFYRQAILQCNCARKEPVGIDILSKQSIRIVSRPSLRIRKWNQPSHFRLTSTRVIPIEAGYISAISQVFRRGSK